MMKYAFCIILSAILVAGSSFAQSSTSRVIAHRGYWKAEGSAQNSIAALRNAAAIGVYGSEFDVNVTNDGVAVIHHDNTIDGKRIEDYPYSEFASYTLPNGEKLPRLEEYLAEGAKYPDLKLILEIKRASSPEVERRWVEIIMSMVKERGLESQVEYISFSINIVKAIIERDPTCLVAYLNGNLSPEALQKKGIPGLDYHFSVMAANPDWFTQAQGLNMFTNVWTVNDPATIRQMISYRADFITTDEPLLAQQLIQETDCEKLSEKGDNAKTD